MKAAFIYISHTMALLYLLTWAVNRKHTGKPQNDLDPTDNISSAVMLVSIKKNNKTVVRSFRNE